MLVDLVDIAPDQSKLSKNKISARRRVRVVVELVELRYISCLLSI